MTHQERRTRRALLASIATSGLLALSGCSDGEIDVETNPTPSEQNPTETDGEPVATATETPEEGEPKPDPRFTVYKDGSGDYESLQEAYDVSQPGDVIEIGPGEYSFEPGGEIQGYSGGLKVQKMKPLQMVGQSMDETTVKIEVPESLDPTTHELEHEDGPKYWSLTLDAADPIVLTSHGGLSAASFFDCRVDGGIGTGTNVNAVDTIFTSEIAGGEEIGDLDAINCRFTDPVQVRRGTIERSVFESTYFAPVDGSNDPTVVDSELLGGVVLPGEGEPTIKNCVIKPKDGSAVAIEPQYAPSGTVITGCEIHGQVVGTEVESAQPPNSQATGMVDTITKSTFKAPDGVEYFIDGSPVKTFWANSFQGADVRIEEIQGYNSPPEITAYDEDQELGNYYSEWDGSEDRGDGVSKYPRRIPGSAEVVDQYPLVEPDLDQYLS